MDVNQALHDAENALRDFINYRLTKEIGENWSDTVVDPAVKRKWEETKRRNSTSSESRLIYYSDFNDLLKILEDNWSNVFEVVFGNWDSFKAKFKVIKDLRNDDSHRRVLLNYQEYQILGIGGEFRSKIIQYRNQMDDQDLDKYFPRIESIQSNIGLSWDSSNKNKDLRTDKLLWPGDEIEFVVTAFDPMGKKIYYCLSGLTPWRESNRIKLTISEEHLGETRRLGIFIKNERRGHRYTTGFDDRVNFYVRVLPREE